MEWLRDAAHHAFISMGGDPQGHFLVQSLELILSSPCLGTYNEVFHSFRGDDGPLEVTGGGRAEPHRTFFPNKIVF